jgi:predicted nucleic-acid-binding Zn-ribbon protein
MKATQRCGKCGGKKIWLVDPFRVPSDTLAGQELSVVPHQGTGSGWASLRANPVGSFELFLCAACGYSELYAKAFKDLEARADGSVRLLDMSDASAGPFR